MLLTVLGCSGSIAGPTSAASGYLVRTERAGIVLDLGNGCLGALQQVIDPFSLDGVVVSHLHADHCLDLAGLIVYWRHHPRAPSLGPLPLHAPAAAATRLAAAYAADETERAAADLSDVFEFRAPPTTPAQLAGVDITAVAVDHPVEAYGLRVSHGGHRLVYTGDTGPCPQLAQLADGADLLLAEASWPHDADNPTGLHLSGRQAGELAADAGVGRLVITHVPPWTDPRVVLDEATRAFDGPVELAYAGVTYDVGAA